LTNGKLFKNKQFVVLEIIKLPEGDVTRETSSLWSKFKSTEAYAEATQNQRAVVLAGQGSKIDIEAGIQTFKSAVWSKPLPRTLIKTFGYGVGVPMYWGMMTALGPFGLVMGALGIGAMAHQEYKHYRETGGL
jgi:hypothetical protein